MEFTHRPNYMNPKSDAGKFYICENFLIQEIQGHKFELPFDQENKNPERMCKFPLIKKWNSSIDQPTWIQNLMLVIQKK